MKALFAGAGSTMLLLAIGTFGFRALAPRQFRTDVLDLLRLNFIANSDSPVVVRGGSFSAVTYSARWTKEPSNPNLWSADINHTPDLVSMAYVDPGSQNKPQDEGPWVAQNNWYITVMFQDNATPDLIICTQLANGKCDLGATGTLRSTKIFFQADASDKIESSINTDVDRSGQRLAFTSLSQCKSKGVDDLDPKCNHIKSIQLHGIPSHDGTYQCVDGACEIEIEH